MAVTPSGKRRYTICGLPLTFEVVLRVVLLLATVGALIGANIPKIKSILQQAKVVSVTMTNSDNIPAPGVLICGELMDSVSVEMVSQGLVYPNGTVGPDVVRPVPSNLYSVANAADLHLRANGDWPTLGKCVILQPTGLYYAKNTNGTNDNALDTIVFVALSQNNFTVTNDIGLSIAMWDGDVPMVDQEPIWTGIPSINTLTFVYSEHILLHQAPLQTHYTLQKQNLRTMQAGFFANPTVIGRVIISPDTFYVTRYFDKPSYTWSDLAGAVGGMASIALAIWIFLFGSGKYKSWGVMQRFVLRTSPNSARYQEKENVPKSPYVAAKQFFKEQLLRLNSGADDLDNMPLHPIIEERRRLSSRYSTAINMNTATAAAATGAPLGNRQSVTKAPNLDRVPNELDPATARYSTELGGLTNYYFSEHGALGSQSLQPLAPITEGEDDAEEQVRELIRLIDLRLDERMWSLERTLSRYYLDGFRLRNYSSLYTEDRLYQQTNHKNEEAGQNNLAGSADHHPRKRHFQGQDIRPYPSSPVSSPASSPAPTYPARPILNHQYEYIDETNATTAANPVSSGQHDIPQVPAVIIAPPVLPQSNNNVSASGFSQRRDMRGTIRRAVERLQNEWPQGHEPEASYTAGNTTATQDYNPPQY